MSGSIINTFYMLYKSNAEAVIKGNKDVEKSTKDTEKALKNSNEEAYKLGASFEKMADKAAGFFGAYVGFSVLKTGISDAIALNTQIYTTAKLYGESARQLKLLGQASAEAGGSQQGAQSNLQGIAAQAAAQGLAFNPIEFMNNLRAQIKLQTTPQGRARVLQNAGINDTGLAMLAISSDQEYASRLRAGAVHGALSDEDAKNAYDANSSIAGSAGMLSTYFTQLTNATKPLIDGFTSLTGAIAAAASSSPAAAGATGAAGLAASWFSWKGIKALFSRGGAAAATEGASAAATAGEAAAAGGAAIGVAPLALPLAWGGLLSYGGLSIPAVQDAIETYLADGADPHGDYKLGGLSRQRAGGAPVADDVAFWMSKGYTKEQAAGIIANMRQESGGNARAVGDFGQARGLFQWHPDRRANILKGTGIDVTTASYQDQLNAAAWEMQNGRPGFDDQHFRSLSSADAAGAYFSQRFESPANGAMQSAIRAQSALGIASQFSTIAPTSGSGATSVKIDKIEVHTKATDAAGISQDIGAALSQHLSTLQGNFDDGVAK